jgi:drug/metabolite transporter (DMT)-like permease
MSAHSPAPYAGTLATAALIVGAVLFGLTAYFGRTLGEAGLAGPAIAAWRFGVAAVVLLPVLLLSGIRRTELAFGVGAGAALGLGWIGYVEALRSLPVAEVAVLFMTYPFFTILIAAVAFRERPRPRALVAAGLVLAAAAVATGPGRIASGPAVLFALAAPAAYGLLLNVLARKLGGAPPLAAVAAVALGATLGVAPLLPALPAAAVLPSTADVWAGVLAAGVLTALLPQLLYVRFAPRVGAVRTSIAGSAELPSQVLCGVVAFGEPLTWATAAGIALVLVAILVGARPPQ